MSKQRNGLLLGVILIAMIITGMGVKKELRIKDALEFTNKDVVSIWLKDKETANYNYDYKISSQDIQIISEEISNNKLKLTSIKSAPQNPKEDLTLLLDGKKIEEKDSTSYIYKAKIYLAKINSKQTYMSVELFDIDGENMKSIVNKNYTIESYKLVNTLDDLYN